MEKQISIIGAFSWISKRDHYSYRKVYSLAVRQFQSEECFRKRIREIDPNALNAPAKLIDLCLDNTEYPVKAKIVIRNEVISVKAYVGSS